MLGQVQLAAHKNNEKQPKKEKNIKKKAFSFLKKNFFLKMLIAPKGVNLNRKNILFMFECLNPVLVVKRKKKNFFFMGPYKNSKPSKQIKKYI